MDYKFIILLVILLGLIFLIVKEMGSVKEELNNTDERMRKSFAALDHKMQMGLASSVNKIRLMNSQYMVDIRKMNDIEGQTILPTASNGYTDSESIKKSNPEEIIYLTEVDDGKNAKTSKSKHNNFQINFNELSKMTDSAKKNTDKDKDKTTLTSEVQKKISAQEPVIKKHSESCLDNCTDASNVNSNNHKNSHNESECSDDETETESNDSKMTNDGTNNDTLTSYADEEDDENRDEEEDDNDDDTNTEDDGDSMTIDINQENDSESSDSNIDENRSISDSPVVTLQSSKKNPKNTNDDEHSENESIATTVIVSNLSNLKSLGPIDDYKRSYLEGMAKQLSIPISRKDGPNNRRKLKREELYNEIQEKIVGG
jgi:hypothetical protein